MTESQCGQLGNSVFILFFFASIFMIVCHEKETETEREREMKAKNIKSDSLS
jgi:hypothetical protein